MTKLLKGVAIGAGAAAASYAGYVATTWLRYGRSRPARGAAGDALLDVFMPQYDVHEREVVPVTAPPEVALRAAAEQEFDRSRIVRAIFTGREWILRSRPDPTPRPKGLVALTQSLGWGVLARTPVEIVMGAATKPWEANPVFRPIAPDAFAAFAEPGYVKIAWTLRADPSGADGSTFRTETRAVATDRTARRKFRWYWSFLSPGIIAIREAMLRPVAEAAESAARGEPLTGHRPEPGRRRFRPHARAGS